MNNATANILRFLLVIVAQVFVLINIHLFGCVNAYLYLMALLMLPFEIPRWVQYIIGFVTGFIIDMFIMKIDDIYVGEGVGINEVEENLVSVYPNPANNYINVNATSNIENVEVYTISGQKVGNFTANSTTTTISTANLTSGLYLMKIHTENGVINQKFSVVR